MQSHAMARMNDDSTETSASAAATALRNHFSAVAAVGAPVPGSAGGPTTNLEETALAAVAAAQLEPVHFGDSLMVGGASRRVTIGSGNSVSSSTVAGNSVGALPDHRRGSLSSLNFMDDYLLSSGAAAVAAARRPSLTATTATDWMRAAPLAGAASNAPGAAARRGSLDSTTAALDAAILGLTRRRLSMALGGTSDLSATATTGVGATSQNLENSNATAVSALTNPGNLGTTAAGLNGASIIDLDQVLSSSLSNMNGLAGTGNAVNMGGGASGLNAQNVMNLMQQQQQQKQAAAAMQSNLLLNMNVTADAVKSSAVSQGHLPTVGAQNQGAINSAAVGNSAEGSVASSLAARQQQLQAQQRELERRQRELERQRKELIASMQQRQFIQLQQSDGTGAGGFPSLSNPNPMVGTNSASTLAQLDPSRFQSLLAGMPQGATNTMAGMTNNSFHDCTNGSLAGALPNGSNLTLPAPGTYSNSGSLSLGTDSTDGLLMQNNTTSAGLGLPGTNTLGGQTLLTNQAGSTILANSGARRTSLNSVGPVTGLATTCHGQQWWICQVCGTRAFASHEEALSHEAVCRREQVSSAVGKTRKPSLSGALPSGLLGLSVHQESGTLMEDSANLETSRPAPAARSYSSNAYEPVYSTGPFKTLENSTPLAMPTDKDWLTPLHCFVRKHCVEVFCASADDVAAPSKGKRKPIQVGQIGIRCPHCHNNTNSASRERGSVYYPTTIASIYNATMNLLQRHLHSCSAVPPDIMRRYETLKSDDARSGTSKKYWINSALSLGLVDTLNGIRFLDGTPPPLPKLDDSQTTMQQARLRQGDDQEGESGSPFSSGNFGDDENGNEGRETPVNLTQPEDKSYSTAFSYELLSQMKPCVFTEADRLGKRKGLPPGFPGLACRHCFGGYGSGRFFPSSIKTLSDTSKTLNVLHNHMTRCRKCPPEIRQKLEGLRGSHDEERAKMKFGSQKAFFARIWNRLHGHEKPKRLSSSSITIPLSSEALDSDAPDLTVQVEPQAAASVESSNGKRKLIDTSVLEEPDAKQPRLDDGEFDEV